MIVSREDLLRMVSNGLIQNGPADVDLVSIGLHLHTEVVTYDEPGSQPVVPPCALATTAMSIDPSAGFVLESGQGILACSTEIVRMPTSHMGFIQTKGSIARGFVTAHFCDGQIDPGYTGRVTFELMNFSRQRYRLLAGMPIAQLFILQLTSAVDSGYSGRYQGAMSPTSMRDAKK